MGEFATIGKRLREFGEKRYGTMAEFARALDVIPQTLNGYLIGIQRPGNVMQDRLRKLGADIEWIMTGKSYREAATNRNAVSEPIAAIYGKKDLESVLDSIADDLINEFKRAPLGDMGKAKEGLKKVLRKHLRVQS